LACFAPLREKRSFYLFVAFVCFVVNHEKVIVPWSLSAFAVHGPDPVISVG
jgi:hypothetical protein